MSGISVIIPTYNRATLINRALNSVFSQTLLADEVIVIDDGSSDDTVNFIKTDYPDVILISQDNKGISAARNAGISATTGEWIALLDSDDEWLPQKLQLQMQALKENPEYLIVHTNEIWCRNGIRVKQMKIHRKYGGRIFQHCLPLCAMSPSSVIIHQSILEQVGLFDESLPVCEDYDMWLRICARFPVLFLDEELIIKFGGHADQLSRKYWGMDRFRIQAIEKILVTEDLTEEDRTLAIKTMLDKIHIYLAGARKHNNNELISEFTTLANRYGTADGYNTSMEA